MAPNSASSLRKRHAKHGPDAAESRPPRGCQGAGIDRARALRTHPMTWIDILAARRRGPKTKLWDRAERLLRDQDPPIPPCTAHRRRKTFSAIKSSRAPKAASQKRDAPFRRIASNTGARSPGEELMTCNTSAVAVCCSKASRVSVISRAFSIAMTACAAKFCNSAICLSVNGRTSWR